MQGLARRISGTPSTLGCERFDRRAVLMYVGGGAWLLYILVVALIQDLTACSD